VSDRRPHFGVVGVWYPVLIAVATTATGAFATAPGRAHSGHGSRCLHQMGRPRPASSPAPCEGHYLRTTWPRAGGRGLPSAALVLQAAGGLAIGRYETGSVSAPLSLQPIELLWLLAVRPPPD